MPSIAGVISSEPVCHLAACVEVHDDLPLGSSASKVNGEAV